MQKGLRKLTLLALFVPALAMAQALPGDNSAAAPAPDLGGQQAQPAPLPPVTVDAPTRAAINALLKAINADDLATAIGNSAQQQVKQLVPAILSDALTENKTLSDDQKRAAVPGLQQNTIPALTNNAGGVFATSQFRTDAINAQVQAYARNYSLQDIKDLTKFYLSPIGQKFIKVQDQVGREVIQSLMQKYMPQAIQTTRGQADQAIAAIKPGPAAAPAK